MGKGGCVAPAVVVEAFSPPPPPPLPPLPSNAADADGVLGADDDEEDFFVKKDKVGIHEGLDKDADLEYDEGSAAVAGLDARTYNDVTPPLPPRVAYPGLTASPRLSGGAEMEVDKVGKVLFRVILP